ncbi:leucine-rich repeat-containing protein 66 [Ranitomeya variabilis]|uniref:leucine-rich repeat-containing protein 66 n=1 Tax=Ranitomeya variabilis TaxID=490064 RepID=UPI004056BB2B
MWRHADTMGISWLFVMTSFLLAGSLRGLETNFTSGCHWDHVYSLRCTSAGITNLQELQKSPSWPRAPRLLKTMKHINLSNNRISSFHLNIFYKFSSLETLNISNNYISMISINYEQEGKDVTLVSLKSLVIDRNRLTFVPKGLGKLTSLQTLQLSANSILRIQRDDFANCTQLHNLDLRDNRIHKIDPDAFRDLRNLQILRLSNNALVSITPLVFLYSHVLRADIDLSYNRWACDCRIQPLKHLLTTLPVGISKEWNVTCNTPLSRAGTHLLSISHINGSCRSPVDKHIYARKIIVKKMENIYLPCNITDKTGCKKTFWWTPQGIISGEPTVTNHYIDKMNNFILTNPDRSHEGLYICIAGMERIVYQVHFQIEAETPIRRPRDVSQLNARIRTDKDFTRAVVLSVVISFICAFVLGVFLRPYLETLWRKLCKSKDSKKKTSDEAYDNEGFSEENVSRRHSSNGAGSRLPMHVPKEKSSGSDSDFEEPDGSKYENVTYNEREIYYKDEPYDLDTQIPTRSEVQKRSDTPEIVKVKHKNVHSTSNSHSKTVTWASDKESSPKVNLRSVMLLLKPIKIIVPATEMENTDNHYQNITPSVIPKKTKGSFSDSISSNDSEFWDAEDRLPDEDIIVKYVSTQQVGSTSKEHVIPTVNLRHVMSLLKPINFIVPVSTEPEIAKNHYEDFSNSSSQFSDQDLYDNSLSDDGSSSSDDDHSSKKESIIIIRANKENNSYKLNLKHAMSLLKPINIIVPEFTAYDIVKSPTKKQMFPFVLPRYPKYNMDNYSNQAPENQPTKDAAGKKTFYDSTSSDDGSIDYDDSSDEAVRLHPVLLPTMRAPQKTKTDTSPTVNLQQAMSLLKPINIIVPSTVSEVERNLSQDTFYPCGSRPPKDIKEESTSSDEGSSFDYDDSSDEEVKLNSGWSSTQQASWTNTIDTRPTVNLQQVISLLKPISIIAPEFDIKMEERDIVLKEYQDPGNQSPNPTYEDSFVSSTRPTIDLDDNQTSSDSSSSEDESKKDHSSDEGSVVPYVSITKHEAWSKKEKPTSTVNLKHVMSLLKPINIIIPESTAIDQVKRPSQILFFPTSVSRYPGHSTEDFKVEPEDKQNNKPPTLLIYDREGKKSTDSSSSDDGSDLDYDDSSNEEVKMTPVLLTRKEESWTHNIDTRPIVNLPQVMSLLRPISIIAPDFEKKMEDEGLQEPGYQSSYPKYENNLTSTRPTNDFEDKQTSSDSSSSDNESKEDYRLDDGFIIPSVPLVKQETWANQQNVSLTVNLKHVMSLLKPINVTIPDSPKSDLISRPSQIHFFPGSISKFPEDTSEDEEHENRFVSSASPTDYIESKETSSDSSSSDDESKEDYRLDNGFIIPSVSLVKQETWASQQNVSPTVNLKHVMSLLKPINVTIPESPKSDLISRPSQIQYLPGSISKLPEHISEVEEPENRFVSSTSPTDYIERKETSSDSSSSDDESKEDYRLDDGFIIPSVSLVKQETWANQQNVTPTVNLKHVMSLLKPISVTIPDSPKSDLISRPSQIQFFPGSISKFPEHTSEDEEHENRFVSSTSPTDYIESKETSSDSSSSDDESKEDYRLDDGFIIPSVSLVKQETWASQQNDSPTVNLKHVMSLLKPINVTIPESPKSDLISRPSQIQYLPGSISKLPEHISEVEEPENRFVSSTSPTDYIERKETSSDSSSSDDESKEDYRLDDGFIIPSVSLVKQETWANQQNVTPTVNLKHVMSLLKPINVTIPDSPKSDLISRPSQIQFLPGSISKLPEHISEVEESENRFVSSPSPTDYIESKETSSDSSSSDDESKEDYRLDDGFIIPSVSLVKQETWASQQNDSPTVNLKHVMSLLKPINVTIPESPKSDLISRPSQIQFLPGSISKLPEHISEVEESENRFVSSTSPTDYIESKETSSDSSSSDDESKEDYRLDDGFIIPSVSLVKQETWANHQNVSPTVNLKHVMSLLKPINVTIPEFPKSDLISRPSQIQLLPGSISKFPEHTSEDEEHENRFVSSASPTDYIESKETSSDSSSSDDESKEHYRLDDGFIIPSVSLVKQETWANHQNVSPTVNLKHVMSLLKPINVTIPEFPKSDLISRPSQIQLLPGSISKFPEHTSEDEEPENRFVSSTSPKDYIESKETSSDSSSSDDESKEDYRLDDAFIIPSISLVKQETLANHQNVSPTVNLKHVMSLLKPINVTIPESPKSDLISRPSQIQFLPGSISKLPEHTSEVEEPENRFVSSTSPTDYIESKEASSDSSSSDDESKEDYRLDDGFIIPSVSLVKQETWANHQNVSPTVNLKHVMSLLKPINVTIPEFPKSDLISRPSQIQLLPGSISKFPEHTSEDEEHENRFVSSPSPTDYIESKETSSDSSSSDDESKEDYRLDDGFIIPSVSLVKQETWVNQQNISPTVNLKHVMSLLKPINVTIPESPKSDLGKNPLQSQFFSGSISRYPMHRMEDRYSSDAENKSYDKKQNIKKSPTFPLNDGEGNKTFYESSSSNYSKKDSSNEEVSVNPGLLLTKQPSWTRKDENPKVNLRQVISLLKPINIVGPNYSVTESSGSPSQKQFYTTSSTNHEDRDCISSTIVINDSKREQVYDTSSSEEESTTDDDDQCSIEENIKKSDLFKTKQEPWTSKVNVCPTVNFKHAWSLVRPINIISPESVTDVKLYYPYNQEYIKQQGGVEIQPQDSNYETPHSEPTEHERYKEILSNSTSSDDDLDNGEDNSSDEGGGMNSDLLLTMSGTWEYTENINPNVNLKYVMSLVKPVNIKAPDSTVTEALRRFQEKYNVEVRRYKAVGQLQNETYNDSLVPKLKSPKSMRDNESKRFVYEINQDFDATKVDPKLLTWENSENPNQKVNLKHTMSLLKPINIIAPDFTTTVAVTSPEQTYFSNIYQPRDGMENVYKYHHHGQDYKFDGDSSRKQLNNTSYKGLNSSNSEETYTFYNRFPVDESSQISYKGDIKDSAPPPKWTTPAKRDNTSHKLNLRHVMSLLKPIRITVPDYLSTDAVMSPTKVPVSERLSHNTISEYYTDTINDSSSDDGSFSSFSQSNSLSNESGRIDTKSVKRNSKKEKDKGKVAKSGERGITYPKTNMAYRDEKLKEFAGGEYEPNKAKDVLHWLNTNTNDKPNTEFSSSKTPTEQTSEQELVLDLNNQGWTTRTIVRKENLSMPTYFLPDFGETSTDGNLIDFTNDT